jgi:hypothetical protein
MVAPDPATAPLSSSPNPSDLRAIAARQHTRSAVNGLRRYRGSTRRDARQQPVRRIGKGRCPSKGPGPFLSSGSAGLRGY